ncbi:MAG: transglutaminase domain-containing protein, partial [Sneathiella sp.]
MKAFAAHSALTSPGKYAHVIDALPNDVALLLDMIRGLLVHSDFLEIYGVGEADFSSLSRETLAFEKRLDQVFESSNEPLTVARPVNRREVGTCRDYAVMVCSMLRQKSVPSRIRCGFARYFSPGRFEDHWICEYWRADEKKWARADAQLDPQLRDHLGIEFDSSDMPDGEFVTANEAWNLVR